MKGNWGILCVIKEKPVSMWMQYHIVFRCCRDGSRVCLWLLVLVCLCVSGGVAQLSLLVLCNFRFFSSGEEICHWGSYLNTAGDIRTSEFGGRPPNIQINSSVSACVCGISMSWWAKESCECSELNIMVWCLFICVVLPAVILLFLPQCIIKSISQP